MTQGRVRSRAVIFIAAFTAGGVAGALLDQIHVRAHVLRYAHPDLAGQPWWVAPQFGLAVALILGATIRFARPRDVAHRDKVPLIADAVAFVLAYTATGAFHHHPWLIAIILVAVLAGMLLAHRDKRTLLSVSIGLGIIGPIYESLLTWTGAFRYSVTPLALRVPLWLPLLYLNAGVLAASTGRAYVLRFRRLDPRTPTVTRVGGATEPFAGA